MKDKYTPGQDCGCYAYSESECGCGADWTPSEVHELRGKLERERALADRLAGVFEHFAKIVGPPDSDHDSRWVTDDELDDLWQRTQSAIAAWKEARSE